MDSGELYRKLRDELLPESFKHHFDESKTSLIKNKKIIESMQASIYSTDGEKALLKIIKILANKIYDDTYSITRELEALFVYHCITQKKIGGLITELKRHDIKINDLTQFEEGLRWVDDYIKHSSETSHD